MKILVYTRVDCWNEWMILFGYKQNDENIIIVRVSLYGRIEISGLLKENNVHGISSCGLNLITNLLRWELHKVILTNLIKKFCTIVSYHSVVIIFRVKVTRTILRVFVVDWREIINVRNRSTNYTHAHNNNNTDWINRVAQSSARIRFEAQPSVHETRKFGNGFIRKCGYL